MATHEQCQCLAACASLSGRSKWTAVGPVEGDVTYFCVRSGTERNQPLSLAPPGVQLIGELRDHIEPAGLGGEE